MIYKIPEYGIVVETRVNEKGNKVTTLSSELRDQFTLNDGESNTEGEAMANALESLIMAHAAAGINITSKRYLSGLHTAVEACGNNL